MNKCVLYLSLDVTCLVSLVFSKPLHAFSCHLLQLRFGASMPIQNLSHHTALASWLGWGLKLLKISPSPSFTLNLAFLGGCLASLSAAAVTFFTFLTLPLYSLSLPTELMYISQPTISDAVLCRADYTCAATDEHGQLLVPACRTYGTHVVCEDADHDLSYCVVLFMHN
jgi:hypothetical protein